MAGSPPPPKPPPKRPLLASEIFALSQGLCCDGRWRCHWCGAPCANEFVHDDDPPIPFVRTRSSALCPGESYICVGCWAWRRQRVTVTYLDGGQLDRQQAKDHSWWITPEEARAISARDAAEVYLRLLSPPRAFVLLLREPGAESLLQLGRANDNQGLHADTPLHFTVNNTPHAYSAYELEEAVKNGPENYGPGVRALYAHLGAPPAALREALAAGKDPGKKGRGRPDAKDDAKYTSRRVLVASGAAASA